MTSRGQTKLDNYFDTVPKEVGLVAVEETKDEDKAVQEEDLFGDSFQVRLLNINVKFYRPFPLDRNFDLMYK
jgi:hypothetical protein